MNNCPDFSILTCINFWGGDQRFNKHDKQSLRPTKVLPKAGRTEDQSAANRYCTASGLDRILFVICF